MGTQFLPLRHALFGWLLALAVVIGAVSPAWKAEAVGGNVYSFTESAPPHLIELVRERYGEWIEAAQKKYPSFKVQILIGKSHVHNWKDLDRFLGFRAVLAGNPLFCNELGCLVVWVHKKINPGFALKLDPERNGEDLQEYIDGVPAALYTNGYMMSTDTGASRQETRKGCIAARKGEARKMEPSGRPCYNWTEQAFKKRVRDLGFALRSRLNAIGFEFDEPAVSPEEQRFPIRNCNKFDQLELVLVALQAEHDFSWRQDGCAIVLMSQPLPPGLFYHEAFETEIKWVTE